MERTLNATTYLLTLMLNGQLLLGPKKSRQKFAVMLAKGRLGGINVSATAEAVVNRDSFNSTQLLRAIANTKLVDWLSIVVE